MRIISDIIDQYAEEAAFLWFLRDRAVSEPHYDLSDLADLDSRVEAHIDGLRLAGDPGWMTCERVLALEEPGEVFAAGVLAFESDDLKRIETVLSKAATERNLQRALVSALGWIDFDRIAHLAQKLITANYPFLKYLGIAAFAVHRQDPGVLLEQNIHHADPALRARALKAVAELGRIELCQPIRDHFQDGDAKCQFYAAWAAALAGDPHAISVLTTIVHSPTLYACRACDMVVRKMAPASVLNWLEQLFAQPERSRMAILGYGALGDPVIVPWLIEIMRVPELSRPAGESFSLITGVDIADAALEGECPCDFEIGPTEDPEDENVDLDPDEDLPWPDPELIQEWWFRNENRFKPGMRYLLGNPICGKTCQRVLRTGFQRQRAAASVELAIMNPGQPLFEIRAKGVQQQRMLGASQRVGLHS